MPQDVGKTFLNHAEQSGFFFWRKALQRFVNDQIHVDAAAARKALGIPLQSGLQAEFVKQRRVQQVGKSANFFVHLEGEIGGIDQSLAYIEPRVTETIREVPEGHDENGEFLSSGIVQVASDLAALLILELKDARRKGAQGELGLP